MDRATKTRTKITVSVERKILAFYEGKSNGSRRCVVTGDTRQVDLHHLDETPSHSAEERNLLPLKHKLNVSLDSRQFRRLHSDLLPGVLAEKAGEHYANGKYTYAYGCSVLGASLAFLVPWKHRKPGPYYIDETTAAYFAANALVSLRPLNRVDYACHVLNWLVLPILRRWGDRIERPVLARLTMEIGSYFRDALFHREALEWSSIARRALRGEIASTHVRTLLARLHQHDAITHLTCDRHEKALESLRRARDEITIAYSIGHANEDLYREQVRLRSGQPDLEAVKNVVKGYLNRPNPSTTTKWTARELQLTLAQAQYQRGDKRGSDRAFAVIREFLRVLERNPVVPTQAIFPRALRAFADQYPSHRRQVEVLARVLPPEFLTLAAKAKMRLWDLVRRSPVRIMPPNRPLHPAALTVTGRG